MDQMEGLADWEAALVSEGSAVVETVAEMVVGLAAAREAARGAVHSVAGALEVVVSGARLEAVDLVVEEPVEWTVAYLAECLGKVGLGAKLVEAAMGAGETEAGGLVVAQMGKAQMVVAAKVGVTEEAEEAAAWAAAA